MKTESLLEICCTIDDMTGEELGLLVERAIHLGALDSWLTLVQMKKNRPGFIFSVLVKSDDQDPWVSFLLEETTSWGCRIYPVDRIGLNRTYVRYTTSYGDVSVKRAITPSGKVKLKIEWDDLHRIHNQYQIPIHQLRTVIQKEILEEDSKA
jgi:pyridinium-3,5-bisthiocarboxylic acid mononucleotide nickel chelatase